MLLENISLGRVVEIYVDREGYRYRLTSKVEYTSERRLCVTLIASNNRVFMFKPEDTVHVVYRDTEQLWEWDNVKAGMVKMDGVPVHYFDIRDKGRSFNRRNAYRVDIGEELMLGYYEDEENRLKSSDMPIADISDLSALTAGAGNIVSCLPKFVQGLVKDISETGVGICTNCDFNVGDSMFMTMASPYGDLEIKAEVVRRNEIKSMASKYRKYYGAVFSQTDKRLIRYIFDLQREALKKQRQQEQEEQIALERLQAKKEKLKEQQKEHIRRANAIVGGNMVPVKKAQEEPERCEIRPVGHRTEQKPKQIKGIKKVYDDL